MQNYFPCCVLCKGSQYFRAQQYKSAMCPPKKKKEKKDAFSNCYSDSMCQCSTFYSVESVSKSEPLMRIIKYAVGFAHK